MDENNEVLNNEELENNETPTTQDPVVEEPSGDKEPTSEPLPGTDPATNDEDEDADKKKKQQAAYIALRYLGITPPSL